MPRDIERERNRKLYLAGASRKQVMRNHRASKPEPVAPMSKTDKAREAEALAEWQYLNRD